MQNDLAGPLVVQLGNIKASRPLTYQGVTKNVTMNILPVKAPHENECIMYS